MSDLKRGIKKYFQCFQKLRKKMMVYLSLIRNLAKCWREKGYRSNPKDLNKSLGLLDSSRVLIQIMPFWIWLFRFFADFRYFLHLSYSLTPYFWLSLLKIQHITFFFRPQIPTTNIKKMSLTIFSQSLPQPEPKARRRPKNQPIICPFQKIRQQI